MVSLFIFAFLFMNNIVFSLARYYEPIDCSKFSNSSSCISEYSCMWCEYENSSGCKQTAPCSSFHKNCNYKDKESLEIDCFTITALFYLLIVSSYMISISSIFNKTHQIFENSTMNRKVLNSINTIILVLVTVPFCVIFLLKPSLFYILFIAYIIAGLCIHACITVVEYKNKSKNKIVYDTIN